MKLEHDASTIKVQTRRQTLQADLQAKREIVKQLNRRLMELDQLDNQEEKEQEDEKRRRTRTTTR